MRQIKFRALDRVEKRMVSPKTLQSQDWNVLCNIQRQAGNWEFMQFTGLLDKNGKEIYEGDIVEFHAFTFNGSETEYDGKGIVKYRNDGMCFVIEEKNDFDWMVRDTSNFGEACFEIIGNIYENPELLEPNKN